jgi:hypothetical protein
VKLRSTVPGKQAGVDELPHTCFTGYVFAILSNRTMLVDFSDDSSSCRNILALSSWVPSSSDVVNRTRHSTEVRSRLPGSGDRRPSGILEEAVLITALHSKAPELEFTQHFTPSVRALLGSPTVALPKLEPELQDRFRDSIAEGTDYLYGMAFYSALEYSSSIRRSLGGPTLPASLVDPSNDDEDNRVPSYLHAAAVEMRNWDDSKDYAETAECLSSAIDLIPSSECVLYVLLDGTADERRTQTINKLTQWINESSSLRRCTISIPPIESVADDSNGESGTDLETWSYVARVAWMSSHIRWAYVGPLPTDATTTTTTSLSSSLLLQTLQYQRRSEVWHQGRDPPIIPWDLSVCGWR